jgi:hypothetical protein
MSGIKGHRGLLLRSGAGAWVTASSWTKSGDSSGWSGYTLRTVIPSGAISQYGSKCRLTISSVGMVVANAYFQEGSSSGDPYDFASTPVQILFGGSGSYSGGSVLTDEIAVSIQSGKRYVAAFYFSGTTSIGVNASLSTWTEAYKLGSDASTVNATGYTTVAQAALVNKLEVFQP